MGKFLLSKKLNIFHPINTEVNWYNIQKDIHRHSICLLAKTILKLKYFQGSLNESI